MCVWCGVVCVRICVVCVCSVYVFVMCVCPKHVELYIKIKLRNTATRWLLLYEYITIHGPQNVQYIQFLECILINAC